MTNLWWLFFQQNKLFLIFYPTGLGFIFCSLTEILSFTRKLVCLKKLKKLIRKKKWWKSWYSSQWQQEKRAREICSVVEEKIFTKYRRGCYAGFYPKYFLSQFSFRSHKKILSNISGTYFLWEKKNSTISFNDLSLLWRWVVSSVTNQVIKDFLQEKLLPVTFCFKIN